MSRSFTIKNGLSSISDQYRAILLDAYGVFWGGNAYGVLPGTPEVMERLVLSGKIVGILSNATALSEAEIKKFALHGMHLGRHFHFVVTAGEVFRHFLMSGTLPLDTSRKTYWILGEDHPNSSFHAIFKDTPFTRKAQPAEADFGYISVPLINGEDQTDPDVFRSTLEAIHPLNIPLICANPDLFAHEGMPPRLVVRQGSIAKMHEENGGKVVYFGKPHPNVFEYTISILSQYQITNTAEMLMVGDTPGMDCLGASRMKIDSALTVHTGVMGDRVALHGLKQAIDNLPENEIPTHYITGLADGLHSTF
jgi:HAD superfamily hydrolase (TIGR01459 family)